MTNHRLIDQAAEGHPETDADKTRQQPDPTNRDLQAIAESATIHSFLNCYLRETGEYTILSSRKSMETIPLNSTICSATQLVHARLSEQGISIYVPLRYRSPTGRHLFELPGVYRLPNGRSRTLDYTTLICLVTTELELSREQTGAKEELLLRILKSCRNIDRFLTHRSDDEDRLYGFDLSFRDAEQSLLFGHQLHPTPKSRQGIPKHKSPIYAPELRGSFPLAFFRATPDLVTQAASFPETDAASLANAASDSDTPDSAAAWIKSALREDPSVPESFIEKHVEAEDVLVPVHPWQADYLRSQAHITKHLGDDLQYLGPVGREFYPTSSVRTLYSQDAPFMVKGSLNVKITNSERPNKRPELERGVVISELLETELGTELTDRFPAFDIVRDPAYITLDLGQDAPESGFETVLRANPFRGEEAMNATPVVALCQDHIDTMDTTGANTSRLGTVIETLAEREGRSTDAVSEDWFQQYLERSIRPVLWLYLEHGLGVEAHQQNSVLSLDNGYPSRFQYRDNQGYYLPEAKVDELESLLPGIGDRVKTVCPDTVSDERIRYYVIINNAFGLINAFGTADLIEEERLLGLLRAELESLRQYDRPSSSLLTDLLEQKTIPCKANLLTRFHDMDELVGSLANQSVYTDIPNPLCSQDVVNT